MRSTVFFLIMFLSVGAFADSKTQCRLDTNFSDLKLEANKKVICNATLYSLIDSYVWDKSYQLVIEISSKPNPYETYKVNLDAIELFVDGKLQREEAGVLTWNPDTERVDLY